jgi:hypothetical protein
MLASDARVPEPAGMNVPGMVRKCTCAAMLKEMTLFSSCEGEGKEGGERQRAHGVSVHRRTVIDTRSSDV